MKYIDIKELLKKSEKYVEEEVTICGWVRTARDSKNIAFIEVNDGSYFENIQLIIDKETIGDGLEKDVMLAGTSIISRGKFIKSERNGYEVLVSTISVLGQSATDYPLQKKRHTLEFLRTIPHLRVRTRLFQVIFTVRDQLSYAIHEYFHTKGYKYVHTPIITASDCEGAGEMFRITTQPWNADYEKENEYYKDDFFGTKANLTVSCQLEGEMAAMGLGRIYTFGPTFRAEHSNTARHAAEFWQVEPEVCFVDIDGIIEIAEDFIKSIINSVLENCKYEMEFLDKWVQNGLLDKLRGVVESSFGKVSYTEAIEILKKSGKEFKYPVEWGCDLKTEHERYLTEEYFKKPIFVVDYPKDIKSFYMKQNDDGKTVAATDLLVPGVGEIIGCSEREYDYDKLKNIMIERGMPLEAYQQYLDTRKFGSVPHSGFGLGLERMVMYVTGVSNIRDTLLFPRTDGSI